MLLGARALGFADVRVPRRARAWLPRWSQARRRRARARALRDFQVELAGHRLGEDAVEGTKTIVHGHDHELGPDDRLAKGAIHAERRGQLPAKRAGGVGSDRARTIF